MTTSLSPQFPSAPEVLDVFGARITLLSNLGGFGMLASEQLIPPGYGVPPHIHDTDDELFYVLDGELTVTTATGDTKACPGECASLPHGEVHAFRNDGSTPARVLLIITPGTQALAMFRQFDSEGRKRELTLPEIIRIAGQHGVRFV